MAVRYYWYDKLELDSTVVLIPLEESVEPFC